MCKELESGRVWRAASISKVEHIVARRVFSGSEQFLVYWKGFDFSAATWEPIDNLLSCTDLLDQFVREIDPIPGANPFCLKEVQKTKTVHLKMLMTRKSRYKRSRSVIESDLYMDTDRSPIESQNLNKSLPVSFQRKKLSESERLIRDTILHESKTMTPEHTSMENVDGFFNFSRDSLDLTMSTPAPKRARKQLVNGYTNIKGDSINLSSDSQNSSQNGHILDSNWLADLCKEELIHTEIENSCMKVTLNNTKNHNTLTLEMLESLRDCFIRASNNSSVKVVLLRNNGDHFCSGIDYSGIIACDDSDKVEEIADTLTAAISNLLETILHFKKPIMAAINGPVLEFGNALVVLSDLVYATSKAVFDLMYSKLGLTPIGCLTYLLPKVIGHGLANSMLYLGSRYQSTAAYDRGLILDVFGVNSFKDDISKKITQLVTVLGKTHESTKRLVNHFEIDRLEEVMREEMDSYSLCLRRKDTRRTLQNEWTNLINLYDNP